MTWNRRQQNLLPKTGQTTSYRNGDDGWFESGLPIGTRFIDRGNGTVRDRATGLVWVKQPELIIPGAVGVHATNQIQVARGDWAQSTVYAQADLVRDAVQGTFWVCAQAHMSLGTGTFAEYRAAYPDVWRQTVWTASAANLTTPATMDWNNSIDNCLALEYAGCDDWRLPNDPEAHSLINRGKATTPQTYTSEFPNSQTGYWTSTSDGASVAIALTLASVASVVGSSKTNTKHVRPVRGGRPIV